MYSKKVKYTEESFINQPGGSMVSARGKRILYRSTAGDAAVDGLFGGLAAGFVMAVYLVIVGLLQGASPAVTLSRFTAGAAGSPLTGLVTHLAVSAIYGVLFGLLALPFLRRWSRYETGWLAGLVYGPLLFGIAELVILPGPGASLRAIPTLHFAIAHLLYGLLLGVLITRGKKD